MARAYATFLNGGWMVQPILIKTPDRTNKLKLEPRVTLLDTLRTDLSLTGGYSATAPGNTTGSFNPEPFAIGTAAGTALAVRLI